MKISFTIILLFWINTCTSEVTKPPNTVTRYNVLRGKAVTQFYHGSAPTNPATYPRFTLCTYDPDLRLDVKAFHVHLSARKYKILLQAIGKGNKWIRSYELQNFFPDPTATGARFREEVEKEKEAICKSFQYEMAELKNNVYFMIKFHNSGEWWCDVYKTYEYHYRQMDKCTVTENYYKAVSDPEYYSVNSAGNDPILPLTWRESQTPAKDVCRSGDFVARVLYFESDRNKGYKVLILYKGYDLKRYTISNSANLVGPVDEVKLCRLFNFIRKDSKKLKKSDKIVRTQYLHKGKWYCDKFKRKRKHKVVLYIPDRGSRLCWRHRDYNRPKYSSYRPRYTSKGDKTQIIPGIPVTQENSITFKQENSITVKQENSIAVKQETPHPKLGALIGQAKNQHSGRRDEKKEEDYESMGSHYGTNES